MNQSDSRIISLDQFRGFTVAGMILVNYVGGFDLTPPVFKHHNTYFSFADAIMPSFHFMVGFALRLVLPKRLATIGPARSYFAVVRRAIGLILLGVLLTVAGRHFDSWQKLIETGAWGAWAPLLKSEALNTLTIIGVTSLWVTPVIARGIGVRLLFLAGTALAHLAMCSLFYFDFMYARPNWLDPYWGAEDVRGLDGGPFGFVAWGVLQILGSLVYDIVAGRPKGSQAGKLFVAGAALMAVGYLLTVLAMSYPPAEPPTTDEGHIQVADSPVMPSIGKVHNFRALVPPPPFVQPGPEEQRQLSYWLMGKRVVTWPFLLVSGGYAVLVYSLFVFLTDRFGLQVGVFRTFGQNALAAYLIHEKTSETLTYFAPADSPGWWIGLTFALYFGITYVLTRYLEKRGIFLRL